VQAAALALRSIPTRASSGGGSSTRADAAPDVRADAGPGIGRPDGAATVEPSGVFVAVGYGGRTTRSIDDGRTWIDDAQLTPNGGDDHMLLRNGDLWRGRLRPRSAIRSMTSPDGHAWVDHGDQNLNQWIGAVVSAPGALVAVGGYGLRATSADGVTWTNRMIDTIASHEAQRLAFDAEGGRFVSSNDDGRLSYSADGRAWQFVGGTIPAVNEVAFGNGVFVGLANTAVVVLLPRRRRDVDERFGSRRNDAGSRLRARPFHGRRQRSRLYLPRWTAWVDHPVGGIMGGALAYGTWQLCLAARHFAPAFERRNLVGRRGERRHHELVWGAFGPSR